MPPLAAACAMQQHHGAGKAIAPPVGRQACQSQCENRPFVRGSTSSQALCQPPRGTWASAAAPGRTPPERVQPQALRQLPQQQQLVGASATQVVMAVRACLASAGAMVKCVEASEGPRGWTVTAYVQPVALKVHRPQLLELAKAALLHAAEQSGKVFVLGYASDPFSPMPLGVGAALAEMQDRSTACWSSFSKGFCTSPGSCCRDHPRHRTGVQIVLKPARNRAAQGTQSHGRL